MDFTFTEEQKMMASAFKALMNDTCSPAQIREAFEGRNTSSERRWRQLAEMGLLGALALETHGGLELKDVDLILIAEAAGHAALPEPLIEHAGIVVPLLNEFANDSRVGETLRQAAAGTAQIAICHPANPFVLAADEAQHIVLCCDDAIHLLGSENVRLTRQPSIDALRRLFKVAVTLGPDTQIAQGEQARAAIARVLGRGVLYTAAQCAGLCERMIQLGAAYALQRSQFGKLIGSYQAIKHHLANVQIQLEFVRPVLYAAAARVTDLDARAQALLSHAKLAAFEAADHAARAAMQIHGAMGYSWEVDLHFYMKRTWALGGAWGDQSWHERRVLSLIVDGSMEVGPDQTFARSVA